MGFDSLGRNLTDVLIQSIINSFYIGISISGIVLCIQFIGLSLIAANKFSIKLYSKLMIFDHIIPKYLFLILISTISKSRGFLTLLVTLSVFFTLQSVNLLFNSIKSAYHENLKLYHSSLGISYLNILKEELFPLARRAIFSITLATFFMSILMEGVLTFIGVGLEFGTPSLGFLVQDGLINLNRNPFEMVTAISILMSVSIIAAYFNEKAK